MTIDRNVQEEYEALNSIQRVAAFMITIGAEAAAEILKFLDNSDVEAIVAQIIQLSSVRVEVLASSLQDFHDMVMATDFISEGGISYAQSVLQEALGETRAIEIIKRVKASLQIKGFNVLKDVDPTQLLSFLQREHPQTIALVMTQLAPTQAADILANLPPEVQQEVVLRFARMERVSPDTIQSVERVLERNIDFSKAASKLGGVKAAAEILNYSGNSVEKTVLAGLAQTDPALSSEIKNLMFTFEDLIGLDDRSIQKLLKEVDNKDLTMALKACSNELGNKLLSNISSRAAEMIREELEYMPPVRLREVEEVQQRIIEVVRRMEEEGQITLGDGAGSDMMV